MMQKIVAQQELVRENAVLRKALKKEHRFHDLVSKSAGDAGDLRAGPHRGALQLHHPDPRRVRHRQGGAGPRHPRREPARRGPLRRGLLRRAHRDPARVGALRPREGRLHRRHGAAQGQVRGRPRRHPLPRRGRRHRPQAAARPAAGAGGAPLPAASAATRRSRWTSASSPPPTTTCRGRWRPGPSARTSSTGSTSSPSGCRRCASGARTSRCWWSTSSSGSRPSWKRDIEGVSAEAMNALLAQPWPGNVRELRNVLERGAVVARGPSSSWPTSGSRPTVQPPRRFARPRRRRRTVARRGGAAARRRGAGPHGGQREPVGPGPRHRPGHPLQQDAEVRPAGATARTSRTTPRPVERRRSFSTPSPWTDCRAPLSSSTLLRPCAGPARRPQPALTPP